MSVPKTIVIPRTIKRNILIRFYLHLKRREEKSANEKWTYSCATEDQEVKELYASCKTMAVTKYSSLRAGIEVIRFMGTFQKPPKTVTVFEQKMVSFSTGLSFRFSC